MKKLSVLLFLIPVVLLSSCGGSGQKEESKLLDEIDLIKIEDLSNNLYRLHDIRNVKTDWGKLGLRGKVKHIKVTENLGNGEEIYDFDFTEQGLLENIAYSRGSGSSRTYHYTDGKLEKVVSRHMAQMVVGNEIVSEERVDETVIEYDEDGLLKDAVYGEGGLVLEYKSMKYDENGQYVSPESYGIHETIYTYDENGRCVACHKIESGYPDDIEVDFTYAYNDKNDLVKLTAKGANIVPEYAKEQGEEPEEFSYEFTYEYTYDNEGNWISQKRSSGQTIDRVIEYF